jgi:hypothetical protein
MNRIRSDTKGISCGVSEGSILGSLLFLIYLNDMTTAVKCKLLLYADDPALLVSGKDVSEIEETPSLDLESVSVSLTDNNLSLHLVKTECILFASKRTMHTFNYFNVVCNGHVIESKTGVTYLGVTLDQSLSGDAMASRDVSKSSNKLRYFNTFDSMSF